MMLEGKTAIITGASRGIGRATVEMFAREGANIWACDLAKCTKFESDMAAIADKYSVRINPLYFDLTDEKAIRIAVGTIRGRNEPVDALINVAGMAEESTSFHMTRIEKMRRTFDVNFFGQTLLTQYISRLMMRQGFGSIVNVASVAAFDGEPAQYEYAASKAAVIGATKELARELGAYGIRVNAVAPGMCDTSMGAQIDDGLRERVLSKVIMGRLGRPEEIASAIAFLASDMASYMTGQIVRVDGGM